MLWDQTSDLPTALGRFSAGYFLVIILNFLLITALVILLWRKQLLNDYMRMKGWRLVHIQALLFCLAAGMLILPALRPVDWRAMNYLTVSGVMFLFATVWQAPKLRESPALRQLMAASVGLGLVLYATTAAVVFAQLALTGIVFDRTMGFVPALLAAAGFVFGCTVGCAIQSGSPGSAQFRALQALAAAVILAIMLNIALAQARQIPRFQQFALEWDARHEQIQDGKQRGLAVVEVTPLTIDLEKEVSTKAVDEQNCSKRFYGAIALARAET